MEGVWTWLRSLDGAWVGLAGVVVGALLAGRYSKRSAQIAALATIESASAQRNSAERTAQTSAKVQLVVARETFRFQQLDLTYTRLLAHLEKWHRWAHDTNVYNYAQHPEDDLYLPFDVTRPHPDDPRYAMTLSFPETEKIAKPSTEPRSVYLDSETAALVSAYASEETKKLHSRWEDAALVVENRSYAVLEYGRALEWKDRYPDIIRRIRADYPETVSTLDKAKQKLVTRVSAELLDQVRIESI